MSTPRSPDLVKKTLNLRTGDFEKMDELFKDLAPSVSIRELISAFVDKHYKSGEAPETNINIKL